MTQTVNSMSWANCKIELSDDAGVNWRDVSGFSNSITVDGGERATSEFFTAEGDTPIVTAGKRASYEITLKAVYTEDASNAPFIMGLTAYSSVNNRLLIRWSPKGGAIGTYRYTSSEAMVNSPVFPTGAADSSDAIPVELKLKCLSITKATVAV